MYTLVKKFSRCSPPLKIVGHSKLCHDNFFSSSLQNKNVKGCSLAAPGVCSELLLSDNDDDDVEVCCLFCHGWPHPQSLLLLGHYDVCTNMILMGPQREPFTATSCGILYIASFLIGGFLSDRFNSWTLFLVIVFTSSVLTTILSQLISGNIGVIWVTVVMIMLVSFDVTSWLAAAKYIYQEVYHTTKSATIMVDLPYCL